MTTHQNQVIDYFDQTHNDYRRLWGIDRHLGLHCGFVDEQHRTHDDAVLHMNRVLASMLFYSLGILLSWVGMRSDLQTRGIASGYYQYLARRRGLGVNGVFLAEK